MQYAESYAEYLKDNRHSSQSTIMSYVRDINKYGSYLDKINVSASKVNKQVIISFLMFMQKNGQAISSILRMIASLRSFYGYLLSTGCIKIDPTEDVEAPKLPKRDFEILTLKEMEILLQQPETVNFKGFRDKAMLELLYATGIKVSELTQLEINDVNLEECYITCGVAAKSRMVPMGNIAAGAIREYLHKARFKNVMSEEDSELLFINVNGGKLSRQGFWKIIKYYKDKAKIEKDITPNTLRHSFAVHLMENGADIASVQEMLGHTALTSTKIYADAVSKRINDVYKKAHPRA